MSISTLESPRFVESIVSKQRQNQTALATRTITAVFRVCFDFLPARCCDSLLSVLAPGLHVGQDMITVRKALPTDVLTVVGYIQKKAAFDRSLGAFDGSLGTTTERIAKALFGTPVFAHALLASTGEAPSGFAFYHYRFSSFQARPILWLDDLYVDFADRRGGVGIALMSAIASEAISGDCIRIEWTADAKNPSGIPFYAKLGATLVSQNDSRMTYSIIPGSLAARIAEIKMPNQSEHSIPRGCRLSS